MHGARDLRSDEAGVQLDSRDEGLRLESRIVGGSLSDKSEYPYVVSLKAGSHFCGGSLIAPDVVLSAA